MDPFSILLISSLMYGSGYLHSYLTQDEITCKEIVLPQYGAAGRIGGADVCFEGYEGATLKTCEKKIDFPKMVMSEQDGLQLVSDCKERLLLLNVTKQITNDYNKDKYIIK